MLFDTHEDPVDSKKTRQKRRPTAPVAEELAPMRPVSAFARLPLGRIDEVFECADEACGATYHEIVDEHSGKWAIECLFCGTGQTVKAIRGHLKPQEREFVFPAGEYAGSPISAVAADPRGRAYVEWAAEEHKSQAVKDACKNFLDANRVTQ